MREFLSQEGVDFTERDFFQQPFSTHEIRELLGDCSPSELFSWRSPSLKAMGLQGKELSENKLLDLMVKEPRLIRRPLVKTGDQLIVGANWKELKEVLK